jgi:glutamate racemase
VTNPDAPIGVFDSGVGGLSVVAELRTLLPHESIVYVADSAYCPYGGRPPGEIRDRSLAVSRFLLARGAKVIVGACNSASGAALESLRDALEVPIVGMEPAVKPAAASTRNGRVGVLATAATLRAERFDRLMASYANGVEVYSQPCPGLVELVEQGITSGAEARAVLAPLVSPLRAAGVDTVVLGCTHYPFLQGEIADLLGPHVTIIDTGLAVARRVQSVLGVGGLLREGGEGRLQLYTSGDPSEVGATVAKLLGEAVPVEPAAI